MNSTAEKMKYVKAAWDKAPAGSKKEAALKHNEESEKAETTRSFNEVIGDARHGTSVVSKTSTSGSRADDANLCQPAPACSAIEITGANIGKGNSMRSTNMTVVYPLSFMVSGYTDDCRPGTTSFWFRKSSSWGPSRTCTGGRPPI